MLTKDDNWTAAPEALIYMAAVFLGVPFSMWEFWKLERTLVVLGLGGLWLPTVALLIYDMVVGQVSKGSLFFFAAWVAVVIGYGIYVNVV